MAESADLARELLGLASDDEAAARAMLPVDSVTDAIVGFHAQQAVEKALKAVLAAHETEFPFIHNLGYLAELCNKNAIALPKALDGLDDLTPFAAMLRYGSPEQTIERQTALSWATAAVEWARTAIAETEGRQEPSPEPNPGQTSSSSV
jgi:HEPN domain-containing protein